MCVLSKYCPHLDPKHVGIFFSLFYLSLWFFSEAMNLYNQPYIRSNRKGAISYSIFSDFISKLMKHDICFIFQIEVPDFSSENMNTAHIFFTSCFFMQKNFVFNSDETENLRSIFVLSLLCRQRCRRRISEPCQTSKVEHFAKIVNN